VKASGEPAARMSIPKNGDSGLGAGDDVLEKVRKKGKSLASAEVVIGMRLDHNRQTKKRAAHCSRWQGSLDILFVGLEERDVVVQVERERKGKSSLRSGGGGPRAKPACVILDRNA